MQVEEIIVADSSPLIALARIEQLPILNRLAKRVLVPAAVWEEMTQDAERPGATSVRKSAWIEIVSIDPESGPTIPFSLDTGEREAIALAATNPGSVLLVDDLRARRTAVEMGIKVLGTLGLLLRGKNAGFIKELRAVIESLQETGIYLHPRLVEAVLREAGEV